MSKRTMFAFCVLTAIAGAQTIAVGSGTFVDISTTGGTAIVGVADDSEHNIVTTIGNGLFPAGNVRIGNNGAIVAGLTTGDVGFTPAAITTGIPTGLPTGGTGYLVPFWADMYPQATAANTTIYWQEINGVLIIMWKDSGHYDPVSPFTAVPGQSVTFEVQVFGITTCGGPSIVKYLYNDTVFGGTQTTFDNGLNTTVGYVTTIGGLTNVQYSFNTASLSAGLVLDLSAPVGSTTAFLFNVTHPLGTGSVQIDISDCSGVSTGYFIPYTFTQGLYPNGWLFGLDIPITDAFNIFGAGYPFVGPLPQTIGPVTGLPSGLQVWMVAIGLSGGNSPTGKFGRKAFTIP